MAMFDSAWKKGTVILMSLLMAIFTLQSSFKTGNNPGDAVRATIDGQKVRANDWNIAKEEFDTLARLPLKNNPEHSILEAILPRPILAQYQAHPDIYYLMIKEAQRFGISVPPESVDDVLRNAVILRSDFTADEEPFLRQAISHLLAINMAKERAIEPIKISQPMRQDALARLQKITVKVTEFSASEFKQHVSAPTTQQVQEQFINFGNKDSESPDPRNAFGFGYRIPNRIKFQWIELRRADVFAAAKGTHSSYDWDVAAQKYYRMNPQEFPTTAPALQPVVGTSPGVRPFNEVHEEILKKLQDAEADRTESAILAKINSTLSADYSDYKKSPTSPPTTSLGAAYPDYAYLEKLAGQIQDEFKILPAVVSMGDFKSQQQIAETAIGKATTNSIEAAEYLTNDVEPLAPEDQKSHALKILQPSPSMRDSAGNVYIVRVTEAEAARMPSSVADVGAQIDNDLRTVAAFKMAHEEAASLAKAAQSSGLDHAATIAGRKIIPAGPFTTMNPDIPGYPLPTDSARQFIQGCTMLLRTDARTTPHPLAVIDLPRVGMVDVVELQDLTPVFNPNDAVEMADLSTRADSEVANSLASGFLARWFQYDELADRLNYKVDASALAVKKNTPVAPDQTPAPSSPFNP